MVIGSTPQGHCRFYPAINFRGPGISRGVRKLARTFIVIKKKNFFYH